MSYENSAGLNVSNQYGARNTGGAAGVEHTQNSTSLLTYDLTGEMLNSTYAPPVYFPKGALVRKATLRVDEVFVVSGGGTVSIGGTAPATDGITLTEAKLEALGTSDVSALLTGTWVTTHATGPLTTQKIAKAISGTVGATSGKASLVIEYFYKTLV